MSRRLKVLLALLALSMVVAAMTFVHLATGDIGRIQALDYGLDYLAVMILFYLNSAVKTFKMIRVNSGNDTTIIFTSKALSG